MDEGRKEVATLQFHDFPHGLVDDDDSISIVCLFLFLDECQSQRDKKISPTPKSQVPAQCEDADACGDGAEVAVRKLGGVKGQEHGEGQKVAGGETNSLRGRSIAQVLGTQQGERPAYNNTSQSASEVPIFFLSFKHGSKNSFSAAPSTAMSCVAHSITRTKNTNVMAYSFSLASSISLSTFWPSHISITALVAWMGTIQLFRRPIRGDQMASTMGDHSSFNE